MKGQLPGVKAGSPGPGGRMAVHGQRANVTMTANGATLLPSYPHQLSQCALLVTVPCG